MREKPEAIMINVPVSFFQERSEEAFRKFYESMGQDNNDHIFYHFISTTPIHEVTHAYVCFSGQVQYKAIVVKYFKNEAPFPGWPIRNWLALTGPVVKPPQQISQKGFRGFRYTNHLF